MKRLLLLFTAGICIATTGCLKNTSGVCVCQFANRNEVVYNLSSLNRSSGRDSCAMLNSAARSQNGSCRLR